MSNTTELRKYADILAESQINESIEEGILDIVDQRLSKTMGMIEDLMLDIREEAPATVEALDTLLAKLQIAQESIAPIKKMPFMDPAEDNEEAYFNDPMNSPEADGADRIVHPGDTLGGLIR